MESPQEQSHIRYAAAVRQPHHEALGVEAECCLDEEQRDQIEKFTEYKLKGIQENTNFFSHFFNHMGCWYFKGINGITYIVITSEVFPEDLAMECMDEFSEAYKKVSKKWFNSRRTQAQATCCQAISLKYSSVEVDTVPWALMNQVDEECRLEYSKSVRNLFQQVKRLEDQMHDNIQKELQNIESTEQLEALTHDCLDKAKVFRKKAKKIKWQTRWKNLATSTKGVAAFSAIGGTIGFLAGGPGGAFALTTMSSVAAAQAIETSVVASLFGAGYLVAQSEAETWSFSQKFLRL